MTLKNHLRSTVLAAAMAATPILAPMAVAQDHPAAEVVAQDGKIDAYITAALAVAETREAYLTRLQTVEDEAEQIALVEEADAAIMQVVEDTPDITIEEYIAIGEASAQDPELAAQIEARYAEAHMD